MAERIDIVVTERGSRVVRRNIEGIGSSAERAQGGVQLLRRALGLLGGGLAVRELVRMTDTFTNLQNRIRTVTTGTAELNNVTDELFAISRRTRASFEATTEIYARTALAARDLGISQNETLQFTESLNQAVILSGASAQEANAAMIQLSQGLASGALRGDELRSVLEQLPVVADVIADSLGVTRGQLREMGAEGKISADVVLKAFREAREELEDRFGETVPTIGQSFVVLRNSIIRVVGSFSEFSGAASGMSRLILTLADNTETLARGALAAAIAIGTILAGQAIPKAITAVRALTIAIAANPIGAIAVAVVAAVSALIAFSDQISIGEGRISSLQDLALSFFETFQAAAAVLSALFEEHFGGAADAIRAAFGDVELSVEGVLTVVARTVDGIVGFFKGAADGVELAFDNIPAALELIFVKAFNKIAQLNAIFLNGLISATNVVLEAVGIAAIGTFEATLITASQQAQDLGAAINQAIADGITGQTAAQEALTDIIIRSEEIAKTRLAAEAAAAAGGSNLGATGERRAPGQGDTELAKILADMRVQNDLLSENASTRERLNAILEIEEKIGRPLVELERQEVTVLMEANEHLSLKADILEQIRGPQEAFERGTAAINELLKEEAITAAEAAVAIKELSDAALEADQSLSGSLKRGLQSVVDEAGTLGDAIEKSVTGAFKSAEDALVEFAETGKFSFSDLANSILSDLTRIAVQQGITGPLANLLGGLGGGGGGGGGFGDIFASFASSLFGAANGADFNVNSSNTIGSLPGRVDNRVMALRVRDGERVQVTPRNQDPAGQRAPTLVMNINTPDADSFQRSQDQIFARANAALNRAARRNS